MIQLYEPLVVGKFCKTRDPHLAYIAYAKGFCDDELIAITNDNSMFKQQARYLVKHHQPELWAQVLVSDNLHCCQLINQMNPITLPMYNDFDDLGRLSRPLCQNALIQTMSRLFCQLISL